jgi:hypothetical protein
VKSDPMPTAERHRRAQLILARLINEASEIQIRLAQIRPEALVVGKDLVQDERDVSSLGEYAGMLLDAIEGREPTEKRSTAQKVCKAFGYAGRGR